MSPECKQNNSKKGSDLSVLQHRSCFSHFMPLVVILAQFQFFSFYPEMFCPQSCDQRNDIQLDMGILVDDYLTRHFEDVILLYSVFSCSYRETFYQLIIPFFAAFENSFGSTVHYSKPLWISSYPVHLIQSMPLLLQNILNHQLFKCYLSISLNIVSFQNS